MRFLLLAGAALMLIGPAYGDDDKAPDQMDEIATTVNAAVECQTQAAFLMRSANTTSAGFAVFANEPMVPGSYERLVGSIQKIVDMSGTAFTLSELMLYTKLHDADKLGIDPKAVLDRKAANFHKGMEQLDAVTVLANREQMIAILTEMKESVATCAVTYASMLRQRGQSDEKSGEKPDSEN